MLTPEQIKTIDKQIAVLEAAKKEGAIVEVRNIGLWEEADYPRWDFSKSYYRVRIPGTPTRRPLCQEDWALPSGQYWLIRSSADDAPYVVRSVLETRLTSTTMNDWFYRNRASDEFEVPPHLLRWSRSRDGGQTWEPVWKEAPGTETIVSTE